MSSALETRTEVQYNEEAEVATLGAILLDEASLLVVTAPGIDLQSVDFYLAKHQTIFAGILALYSRGCGIDLITLKEELEAGGALDRVGGAAYISRLTSAVPTSANIEFYARTVKDKALRRAIERAPGIAKQKVGPLAPAAELRDEIIKQLPPAAPEKTADPLTKLSSFHARHDAVLPGRIWFWEGVICPGFNMLTAKKAQGKSFLLSQMADSIGDGFPILGRRTIQAKVLFISFELDELDTHERLQAARQISDNAYIVHSWPAEEKGLELAERAIKEYGFQVLIFDTFLPLLPPPSSFEINGYGDSTIYLKWRLMAKRLGAAIVASWHEGKTARDDYMLNAIGSTGMVGQADCIISIDRKRGDPAGKLWIGGNHVAESMIPFIFENGLFVLSEGDAAGDRLTQDEEKTLTALQDHPEGSTTAAVALGTGKSEEAARKALGRLIARGMVVRPRRGLYALCPTGQFRTIPDNSTSVPLDNRTGPDNPLEGMSSLSGPGEGKETSLDTSGDDNSSPGGET
jgi:hypothetical protein